LRQRGSLTVWFTEAAIAAWKAEPRATRGGQPRYSALAITTALTLRAVFRLALRQTEGLIASLLRLLGLDLAAPDHSTISRRGETLPVSRPRPGSESIHVAMAAPNCHILEVSQGYMPMMWELFNEPFDIRPDGMVHAPDRPGLGFTLRADALERFRYVDGPEYKF
jgi:Transposase DDE domain/Enolase C-terminal domain-like